MQDKKPEPRRDKGLGRQWSETSKPAKIIIGALCAAGVIMALVQKFFP